MRVPFTYAIVAISLLLAGCGKQELALKEKNPDGIIFAYQKIDVPADPENPKEEDSYLIKKVVFSAENVPEGKTYELLMEGILYKTPVCLGEFQEKDGVLVDTKGIKDFSHHTLEFSAMRAGEPFSAYLVSKDRSTCVKTTIIPRPLEVIGKDGAKIWMTIEDGYSRFFKIEGSGFEPNEELVYRLISSGEVINSNFKADSQGNLIMLALPQVQDEMGGICKIRIKRKKETLKMEFPWGMVAIEEVVKALQKKYPSMQINGQSKKATS